MKTLELFSGLLECCVQIGLEQGYPLCPCHPLGLYNPLGKKTDLAGLGVEG